MDIWTYWENQSIPVDPTTIAFQPEGSFFKDIETWCKLAKVQVHPCLKDMQDNNPLLQAALNPEALEKLEDSKEETVKPEPVEIKSLCIYSKKLDKNSIHAMHAALPVSQLHTLKFSNNGFVSTNCELLINALLSSKVTRLFFDWNPVTIKIKKGAEGESDEFLLPRFIDNPKLEYLYLRSNEMGDEQMPAISEKIAKNTTLKCLDISMNHFTREGINILATGFRQNRSLELMGLGAMGLTAEDLSPVLEEIGRFKLSEEELQEAKEKIKERDTIIEKNKKLKGKKPEEPVPQLNPIIQDEAGISYELKKDNFRHLNIGLNKLDDSAVEIIDQLLSRTTVTFLLTAVSKYLSKDAAKILLTKFGERVLLQSIH